MAHVALETIWGLSLIKQGFRKFAYTRDFDVWQIWWLINISLSPREVTLKILWPYYAFENLWLEVPNL